jgi:hypothetical protein
MVKFEGLPWEKCDGLYHSGLRKSAAILRLVSGFTSNSLQ